VVGSHTIADFENNSSG